MELKATRDAYGHALLELGADDPRIVVLDADLSRSTRTEWFQQKFPDRFFNLGIAEQNMVGVASGLALTGLIPFATTYAIFVGRAYDQIREAVCYADTNVKVVATHAGLAASYDGGAHQGIEDLALMRVIPRMTVLSPADYNEARQAVRAAAGFPGPVYIRLQKEPVPVITPPDRPFVIGRVTTLAEGDDVALVATGSLTARALAAAGALREEGVAAAVVNVSTLKPLDAAAVRRAVARAGCAVTVEEHNRYGGLHEAVLAALAGEVHA
ncbi:MAG TPA: transketolase C-terminal domain-containing protein, partial [Methylomirabilota bacterium]|nr:transketolase C-terminal domain-containing protein [Methylomirabilota bacterium]